jgi:UDP-3-O-[3-hydroxymyristoyl] glucosamine N-acyltransferase
VVIGDDVEIGANTCIDRGTFDSTQIAKNVKIDNLVQIGHNARLDEGVVICGGSCVAGNAHLGKFVYMGGVSGVNNHIQVGDGAQIGACSCITKDIPPGGTGVGNPQRTHSEHFRTHAFLNRLQATRGKKSKPEK